jgi:mRNA-degrading endonuclease HigB of HigAB toxin-antitoxin module
MFETNVDRRSFLRGSALFAAAIGLTVVAPAAAGAAQEQQKPEEKKDPFADDKNKSGTEKTYVDKDGREYRICPQCAYNMYKQGRMWVCDNCGYSYVE